MKKTDPSTINFYDISVTKLISDKYGIKPFEALHAFICSKTHAMLENEAMGLTEFGPPGIFDLWEVEQITGDPRNSVYMRS